MKIYFDNVDFSSRSGPNTFASRLAKQLMYQGHTLADPNDYDVALVFIQATNRLNLNKPWLLRLDGIWSKPENFKNNNFALQMSYNHAHGVIIQSQFDRLFIERHFGVRTNVKVIYNGIDQAEIDNAIKKNDIQLDALRSLYDKIYISSANWHPQKRLNENYKLLSYFRNELKQNACLVVLGNNITHPEDKTIKPYVYLAGNQEHSNCLQLYSQCDAMFHLAYADHMPNTVIEAVACGLPIYCSNVGGTKEIIETKFGSYGCILGESQQFKFDLFDYDKPQSLDLQKQYLDLNKNNDSLNIIKERINIKNICNEYVEMFDKIL